MGPERGVKSPPGPGSADLSRPLPHPDVVRLHIQATTKC